VIFVTTAGKVGRPAGSFERFASDYAEAFSTRRKAT